MHTLLIANRGEIARRIMRTAREMGLRTVAVFSDADAAAPFVSEADVAVALGGNTPAESYLRVDAIIDAARRTGADAVHPGYGFLAENAAFAQAVIDAGLTWVGPSPDAITAMGSKIQAKAQMQAAGVPVLNDAVVTETTDVQAAGAQVGFPLLVKASAGGGGKGMRIVRDPASLIDAVAAAQREAVSAFGDGSVFLERYVEGSRHIEIQLFGDTHGTVVSLFERECSIQRRHQKILEESPSAVVDEALRTRMGDAAVAAGKALGYVGAGTVEFLFDDATSEFFFLEVNTRLQVEHPVTELITGLDLVRLQLEVAAGAALPPQAAQPTRNGHAIEVRLYAEDPERDFMPVTGTLTHIAIPDGVRVDTGVTDGSVVSVFYDPMIAKVIAHAPTRAEAARVLARALRQASVHGLKTNRELLVRLLEHPEYLAAKTDTGFLERHDPAQLGAPLLDSRDEALHAAAAALADQALRRSQARVLGSLPSGWRNNVAHDQQVALSGPRGAIAVAYRFARDGSLATLAAAEETFTGVRLHACSAEYVDLEVDGVRRSYAVARDGDRRFVNCADGQADLLELPRFPSVEADEPAGSLLSPMPGAVLRVSAAEGDQVQAGAVLLVIEAMKMEQEIVAPAAGAVTQLRVKPGDQVETGSVLAVIEAPEDDEG